MKMNPQVLSFGLLLILSASANPFNEVDASLESSTPNGGLRGRARKHREGGEGGAGTKRNQSLGRRKKNKKKKDKPARQNNKEDKPSRQNGGKNKPNKNKPAKQQNNSKLNARPAPQQDAKMIPRIIGGSEASPHSLPYAVSLQDSQGHFCGGSLIARHVVLSAAHCQGGRYSVALGKHDLDDNGGQRIQMSREMPHPRYNDRTTDNDFMLVFLAQPATLNNDVGLVQLNSADNSPGVGSKVTVMGTF